MNSPADTAAPTTSTADTDAHALRIEVSRRARRVLGDRPLTVDVRVALGCMARIEAQARPGVPEAAQEYRLFDVRGLEVHVRAEFRTMSGPSHVRPLPRRLVIDAGRDGQLTARAHYA